LEVNIKLVAHNSIEYWQAVHLRHLVLREPLALKFSREELMAENDQIHFVAFLSQNQILACLSLKALSPTEIKMRQVAVHFEQQGKGLGASLVNFSEQYAAKKGFVKMTLHAREVACAFYEKLGYLRVGEPFLEVGIEHFKMEKKLK